MTKIKTETYIVVVAHSGHAKGDEITLNARQAQFRVTSGQLELKNQPKKKAGGNA